MLALGRLSDGKVKRGKEGQGGGPMFGLRWGNCVDLQGDEGREKIQIIRKRAIRNGHSIKLRMCSNLNHLF